MFEERFVSHPVQISLDDSEDEMFLNLHQIFKTVYLEELQKHVIIYYNPRQNLFYHMINTSQCEELTKLNNLLEFSNNTAHVLKSKGVIS